MQWLETWVGGGSGQGRGHLETVLYKVNIAQWESARPNLDLPKIEARSEVSA